MLIIKKLLLITLFYLNYYNFSFAENIDKNYLYSLVKESENRQLISFFEKKSFSYPEGIYIENSPNKTTKEKEVFVVVASKKKPTLMYNVYYISDSNKEFNIGNIQGRLYRFKLMDKFLYIENKRNSSRVNFNDVENYGILTLFHSDMDKPVFTKIFDNERVSKLMKVLNKSNMATLEYLTTKKIKKKFLKKNIDLSN